MYGALIEAIHILRLYAPTITGKACMRNISATHCDWNYSISVISVY